LAQKPENFFRDKIRAGYRAPYLKELANRVASGETEPGKLAQQRPSRGGTFERNERRERRGKLRCENLLKLIGRYDGLALDSWTRAQFYKSRNNGRVAHDKKIAKFYARFNSWRGLALWCDMTRDWLEPEMLDHG
jgi:N-glycosylase/DNA lyase